MTGSSKVVAFKNAAETTTKKPAPKKKAVPPLSIRLSADERERLLNAAGSMTIAAYVRLKVFGDDVPPHRKAYVRKASSPSSELTMIGHMLGGLGQSDMARNLGDIAAAAKIGALPVSPELETELHNACDAVQKMKTLLIAALGVKVQ